MSKRAAMADASAHDGESSSSSSGAGGGGGAGSRGSRGRRVPDTFVHQQPTVNWKRARRDLAAFLNAVDASTSSPLQGTRPQQPQSSARAQREDADSAAALITSPWTPWVNTTTLPAL